MHTHIHTHTHTHTHTTHTTHTPHAPHAPGVEEPAKKKQAKAIDEPEAQASAAIGRPLRVDESNLAVMTVPRYILQLPALCGVSNT